MANLYGKYRIEKADGTPTDPNAQYFVLRLDTDEYARDAMKFYAGRMACSDPKFAIELLQ